MAARPRLLSAPALLVSLVMLCPVLGCSSGGGGTSPEDTTAPAAIADLTVHSVGSSSVTLRWSTPGDDGATGQAATYDLRYMAGDVSAFSWAGATPVAGVSAPQTPGILHSHTVQALSAGATYTFALKTADEKPNWSSISNLVSAQTEGGATGCQVVPTSLDFGSVAVGGSVERTFTIANGGAQALSGTVAEACEPFTLVSGGGTFTLAPSESRTVTVRYAPTAEGSHTCVVDTGPAVCADVNCGGTATGASSGCIVSPTNLMFPLTGVNSFELMTFYITNNGSATITGSVSTGCGPFEVMTGGGAYTLTPGQQRMVIVRFAPSAEGSYTCAIDTGLADCADVECSGTCGVLPPGCTVNPTVLYFPDTPIGSTWDGEFTITNDTGGAISGNITSEYASFSVVNGGGPYTLQPGEMVTATVRYAPTTHGTHTGIVRTGLPCIDVGCAGTSTEVNPDCNVYPVVILSFAKRFVGTWEERTFFIQNMNTGTLTGTVGSCSPPFQVVAGGGAYSLALGQSHAVTVRYAPTSAGTSVCEIDTGSGCTNVGCVGIALAEDQPVCTVEPGSLNFLEIAVGTTMDLTFTIRNSGTGTLSGTVAESCDSFSVLSGGGAYSLGAGQSQAVTVRFAPTSVGAAGCDISTGSSCASVHCTGTAAQSNPECTIEPAGGLTFPDTEVGGESFLSFTISNVGTGSMGVNVSEDCASYEITQGGGTYSLGPYEAQTVIVRFAPLEAGESSCSIATGTLCPFVACTGVGLPPEDMVFVPAGTFTMGSDVDEGATSEVPEHTPYVSAYYIDTYEVANDKYAAALNWALAHSLIEVSDESAPYGVVHDGPGTAGEPFLYMDSELNENNQCRITWDGSSFGVESGWERHPVVYVTWFGAAAYCNWRSGMSARALCYDWNTWACNLSANGYRLPTEAEWEKAARGSTDERTYPWGEGIDCTRCNYSPDIDLCIYYTAAVDDPAYADDLSPCGAWQLAGNVWEWCNDWSADDYYASSPVNDPTGPADGVYRSSRGGSWWDGEYHSRCANRGWDGPADAYDRLGFRVVRRP